MKTIGLLIVLGLIAWRVFSTKGVHTVTTDQVSGMLNDSAKQFIDVRTPGEYASHHIKQFKNIPLAEIKSKSANLDKTKETFLICQSGMRSSQAAKQLKKIGFEKVFNVRGGMAAWRK